MTQPALPDTFPWPVQTVAWWKAWDSEDGSDGYSDADWQYLMDTALVHADVWGNWNLDRLPELRQRVQRFGVTPEDKKRLGLMQKGTTSDPVDEIAARRTARGVPAARKGGAPF